MDHFSNFQPSFDKEISINPSAVFSCKISPEGKIDYANHQFCEVSGYEEYELIGETMNVFRHPDMPTIFFEVLMERLQKKEPMRIIAKFLAKDSRYFWLMIDYETKVDADGNIVAHYSTSRAAPQYAVHRIGTLHHILSKIESKTGDTIASKRYLIGFLEERNLTYNQYIEELCASHPEFEKPRIDSIRQQIKETKTPIQERVEKPLSYNSNLDVSSRQQALMQRKAQPHKKSLMKKLFGK